MYTTTEFSAEITDKGYVNQHTALERRKATVERLYGDPPEADVIMIDSEAVEWPLPGRRAKCC